MPASDATRAALVAELQSPTPDLDRVAQLSSKLLEEDPNRARFSVDAGVLARLGRELVARHETALSELVKNAYDADATHVQVTVAGPTKGDFIEIVDNGNGMDREDLISGFMRLATNDKIEHPHSEKFRRRRAGRKGVGRFAAERLGRRLILTAAKEGAADALRIDIDWNRFVPGSDLSAVSLPLTSVPAGKLHGTKLRIERLRDGWSSDAIERSFREVSELIDPGDTTTGSGAGSEFRVRFAIEGRAHDVIDIRSEIVSQAFATIAAEVDGAGNAHWSIQCPRLKLDLRRQPLRAGPDEQPHLELTRNVKLKAYYFIIDKKYFAPTSMRTVQRYLGANGGIRVYRNGFRVPPYGQPGDDWLGLDLLSARRTQVLAPIRNQSFLGSVSIEDAEGLFEETSSREGLIETDAFSEMTGAMRAAIVAGVRAIDAERRKQDQPAPQITPDVPRDETGSLGEAAAADLTQAVADARSKLGASATPAVAAVLDRIAASAQETAKHAKERDALLREIDLLRVLASMGLAIGQFTHEFSTLSGAMRASLTIIFEQEREDAERLDASRAIRQLLDQARDFTGLFRSMTEDNALRERQPLDFYEVAASFRSAIRTITDRNSVNVQIEDDNGEIISPPMHRSELFAVLLNFTTNSIKAVKRAGRKGQILIRLRTDVNGRAILDFADNGDGIAPEVRDRLFDAFVTTTAATSAGGSDEEMSGGSGLGLAIVQDIVMAAGGTVRIGVPPAGYTTCMTVTLPPTRAN